MDFQTIVDGIDAFACVVSVEKGEDGSYGKVRIVTGNQRYVDTIENPVGGVEMLTRKFEPNSEYTNYMTRDLNFEDSCYQAALQKKCIHHTRTPKDSMCGSICLSFRLHRAMKSWATAFI